MRTKASRIAERIALRLDVNMVFEALILNRLTQLPASRREEWLRGLLVSGFQSECLALKGVNRGEGSGGRDSVQRASAATVVRPTQIRAADAPVHRVDNVVTLTALQKVIG